MCNMYLYMIFPILFGFEPDLFSSENQVDDFCLSVVLTIVPDKFHQYLQP